MSIPDWVTALLPAKLEGPDLLRAERAGSSVNPAALAKLLHGDEQLAMRARIESIIRAEGFDTRAQLLNSMGRPEKMEESLRRGKHIKALRKKHNWDDAEYMAAVGASGEMNVYGLHDKAFIKCLTDQTTDEQKALFLEPARRDEIIGCYAQTELSHGSNVRGLETTATWDERTGDFVIHSPQLTSAKWWIGTLGRTANTALVMAQLIVRGKNYGPHTFVVPVRDLKTHEPLPGVYVGDIGPKFGYNSMDNGFALFNHVRIPYVNMLARFQYVDPKTGEYKRRGSPAFVYGGMTYLRVGIAADAATTLARACAIAVRYAAVRKQSADDDRPQDGETAVLNYSLVQQRLLPLIATSYALFFACQELKDLYGKYDGLLSAGKTAQAEALLAELHVQSCALKSHGTTISVEGIETCRRACGGHGYAQYSGIGPLYAEMLPSATYEGDNFMLTKQVSRSILKAAQLGVPLFTDAAGNAATGDADADIVAAFARRVAFQTIQLQKLGEQGWSKNALLVPGWRLSTAYAQYVVLSAFGRALPKLQGQVDAATASALRDLFRLHALVTLDQYAAEFADAGALPPTLADGVSRQAAIGKALAAVRPNAVNLVDGWAFSDLILNSSLGRTDGRVYEDIFRRAATDPVNGLTFDPNPDSPVIIRRRENVAKL